MPDPCMSNTNGPFDEYPYSGAERGLYDRLLKQGKLPEDTAAPPGHKADKPKP
jgi:hypothetical protein